MQSIIEELEAQLIVIISVIAGKYKPMTFDQGPNKGQGPLDGGALAHPAYKHAPGVLYHCLFVRSTMSARVQIFERRPCLLVQRHN